MTRKQPAFATFATLDAVARYKQLRALREAMLGETDVSDQFWFAVLADLREAYRSLPAIVRQTMIADNDRC